MDRAGEPDLEVRAELDDLRRRSLCQRCRDEPVQFLAVVHAQLDAEGGDREQVHDLREGEPRRALAAIEHSVLDVLADAALVEAEQRDDFGWGQLR
jgi:hypothetical protein